MIHILQSLIDGIFPPSPALITLRAFRGIPITTYYEPRQTEGITTLSRYQSPLIKASITAGKFEHNTKALQTLGDLLALHLKQSESLFPEGATLLVPVPLHPKRLRERGYNQVDIILRAAIVGTAYQIAALLMRTSNTSPQSHLKRADRLSHLVGVFSYHNQTINWDNITTVILIDDVATTGSTLRAARSVLDTHLPKHVQLHMVAIAH